MRYLNISLGIALSWWALTAPAVAFEPTTDCVIDSFNSQVDLKADSSAEITETLQVNCGALPNKHGIFRILSTKVANRAVGVHPYTPITLHSITNSEGVPYQYERIIDRIHNTVTWKIGDPNVIISGINDYVIKYRIDNVVIPSDNGNALYLNLNGNFWELPTNNFIATVNLPDGILQNNTDLKLYSGEFGQTVNQLAHAAWDKGGRSFTVTAGEIPTITGITVWAEFPANIVALYQPSWWFVYGRYLYWLPMLGLILLGWWAWKKYGQDPRFRGPIVVEYDPPKGLLPLEAGLLSVYGNLNPVFISATIVDLAVRGYLRIEEIKKDGWLKQPDWKLTLLKNSGPELKSFEGQLLRDLFSDQLSVGAETNLADQRNHFYLKLPGIKRSAYEEVKSFFDTRGAVWQVLFWVLGVAMVMLGAPLAVILSSPSLGIALAIAGIAWIVFGALMSKRTQLGSDTLYQLRGFKLYMQKAETYRMRFYEQEGIFERYLPYAIIFGLTSVWAKAFAQISEEKRQSAYIPLWYVSTSGGQFSIDSFASHLSALSSGMAATLASSPQSSGSGGVSGGGAGGGGGGSW